MGSHNIRALLALLALALIGPSHAQITYPDFSPGCALSGTDVSQQVNLSASGCINGNLQTGNFPSIPNATVVGNNSGATATATTLNPLAVANMMSAALSVRVVSTANLTLSGLQTVDGVAGVAGTSVLLTGQTNSTQDGIWMMSGSAWTRPTNFPSGYIIPSLCDLAIVIEQGTANQNSHWQLSTLAGPITIDTTAQSWFARNTPNATTTTPGLVSTTSASGINKAVIVTGAPGSGAIGDCPSFADAAGSIANNGSIAGHLGPCMVTDANGHVWQGNNQFGNATTVNHGTLGCASSDASACVTGLSAVTSLTVTFGGTWPYTPACGVSPPLSLTAITASAAAVTFTLTSFTGTLYYWCL